MFKIARFEKSEQKYSWLTGKNRPAEMKICFE